MDDGFSTTCHIITPLMYTEFHQLMLIKIFIMPNNRRHRAGNTVRGRMLLNLFIKQGERNDNCNNHPIMYWCRNYFLLHSKVVNKTQRPNNRMVKRRTGQFRTLYPVIAINGMMCGCNSYTLSSANADYDNRI